MTFESPKTYETMDFLELEADPMAGPVLQECALEYLKTEDKEWFNREFTGEIDQDGYLVARENGTRSKPAQCITAGMEWVANLTKKKLLEKV